MTEWLGEEYPGKPRRLPLHHVRGADASLDLSRLRRERLPEVRLVPGRGQPYRFAEAAER